MVSFDDGAAVSDFVSPSNDLAVDYPEVLSSGQVYSWAELTQQLFLGLPGPAISIDLVRHAESVANAKHLIAGRSEWGLTTKGRLQALSLGFRLRGQYDYAWVSDLARTHDTLLLARAILKPRCAFTGRVHLSVPPCKDPRLDERSFGVLEGSSRRMFEAYSKGDLTYAPPNGESYLQLARRLLSFLVDLRRGVKRESRVLILTHIGPMRLLAGILRRLADPKEVLTLTFRNAEPTSFMLTELTWPSFIDPAGVGCDTGKVRLEHTRTTAYDRKI